ncbi:tetratricopeptide repeat-containing sulfotransferase family protein [Rubritalea tangerina]|uniref:Tetratricopeptide repeat-containing sulfotransferase family protein n=1 Tax=Rubritalea tangerina TaxID=430798 RepID=A0ABW4Z9Z3_9BACT
MQGCEQWIVQGIQAREAQLYQKALECFEQAARLDPDDAAILLELARGQIEAGYIASGRDSITRLAGAGIEDTDFQVALAELWILVGETDRALDCYEWVHRHRVGAGDGELEGMLLLERVFDAERIRAWNERVQRSDIGREQRWFCAAIVAKSLGNVDEAIRLYERVWGAGNGGNLLIESGYRLARLYAKVGRLDEAMGVLGKCKGWEAKDIAFKHVSRTVTERRKFDSELMHALPDGWFEDRRPVEGADNVMVFGHPRSGTSLITQRLSQLSGAAWVDEPTLFEAMGQRWMEGRSLDDGGKSMASLLAGASGDEALEFNDAYCAQLRGYREGENRVWIDKNPGLTGSLASVHRLLPGVAWMTVLRDPRDVAMSCYFQRFGATHLGWSCLSPEGALAAVTHTMGMWTKVEEQLKGTARVLVRYEDFVAHEGAELRRILEELAWEAPGGGEQEREVELNLSPSFEDIHVATYQSACGRWREAGETFSIDGGSGRQVLESLGYSAD